MADSTILVAPSSYSYGNQIIGSSTSQVFRISNTSVDATLILGTVGSMLSPFWASGTWPSDSTIDPAGYVDATVLYNPTTLGISTDYIEIPSNDPNQLTLNVNVDGTCKQAVFSVTPTYKSFGVGIKNAVVDQTVSVSNSGNVDMTMGTMTTAIPFSLVDDNVSGAVIAADGTNTFVVRYDATAFGIYNDSVDMSSNDPSAETYRLYMDGTCQQSVIRIDPTYYSFGIKAKNSDSTEVFRIYNDGNVNLTLATGSMSLPFYATGVWPSDATIAPAGYFDATVGYNPTTLSTGSTDYMEIYSNDPVTPILQTYVDGTCQQSVFSVIPNTKDFGTQILNTIIDQTVSVSNSGNINMVMGAMSGFDLPFTLLDDNVSSATIAVDDTHTFVVRYDATAFGTYVDTNTIFSDDPQQLMTSFNVVGVCAQPIITITPPSRTFGSQIIDSTSIQVFRIANTGSANLVIGTVGSMISPFVSMWTGLSDSTIAPAAWFDATVGYIPNALDTGASDYLGVPSNDPVTPEIRAYVDGTCQEPIFAISPASRSFGIKTKDSTTTQVISVTNNGNVDLVISALSPLVSPFVMVANNLSDTTVTAGGMRDATVSYIPPSLSSGSTQTLSIPTNDPHVPIYSFVMDGTCQQSIIGVAPASKSFGIKTLGTTTTQVVTVSNTGNVNLILGSVGGQSLPFWVLGASISDATIAPSSSRDATVSYAPTALVVSNSSVIIPSNDPVTPTYTFGMDGTCQQAVIGVTPTSKAFGPIANLATVDQTVTVRNNGNVNMVMGVLSGLAAPYSVVNDAVSMSTISPSDSSTAVVRFHPIVIGSYADTLLIPSNDTTTPTFSFGVSGSSLEADISVTPASYNFGPVYTGTSTTALITVTNIGNIDLTVSTVAGLNGPFSVINDNASGQVIIPSGTRTLTVKFYPIIQEAFQGHLLITSTDPDTPSYSLMVAGSGAAPKKIFAVGRSYQGGTLNVYDHF